MLLIQLPSNYRQSQAIGMARDLSREKQVLKEHVCWVYMCKFGCLWEPARWDASFLGTVTRRVFLLPRLTFSSCYLPWGQAMDLSRMPHAASWRAHATCLGSSGAPGKGQLSTPSPKSTHGTQMHAGKVGNTWTCCISSCPSEDK